MTVSQIGSETGTARKTLLNTWASAINGLLTSVGLKADASAVAAETAARLAADASEASDRAAGDQAEAALRAAAVTAEATTRAAADTAESTARLAADAALAAMLVNASERPGDNPGRFTATLNGFPENCAALSSAGVAGSTTGRLYRFTGAGIIARRELIARDPSRVIACRITGRCISPPSDPIGDAAQPKIRWLTAAGAQVGSDTVLATWVFNADAVNLDQTVTPTIGGSGIAWPSGAYYARIYLQGFGADGVTAGVAFSVVDITDASAYSPDQTALAARVTALETAIGALTIPSSLATLDGSGFVEMSQQPVTVAQMMGAIEADLAGGVKGFLRFVSSDPGNAVFRALNYGREVRPGGVLATAISAYLQAAVDADPPGLAMSSGTAATQMTTLFTDARALAD